MGCDIHMVLERKYRKDGPWVGVHCFSYTPTIQGIKGSLYYSYVVRNRQYDLFTELAGVRGDSPTAMEPRGLPADMSELARAETDSCGDDGHTHTHMSVEEYATAFLRVNPEFVLNEAVPIPASGTPLRATVDALFGYWSGDAASIGDESNESTEHRVIIWFDN